MAAPPRQRGQELLDYLKEPPFLIVYVGCMILFFGLTIVNAMNASTSQAFLVGTIIYAIVFLVFFGGVVWILPLILCKMCKRGSGTAPIAGATATAPTLPHQERQIIAFDSTQQAINVANPMRTP